MQYTDKERAQDPASIKRQKELQDYWGKQGREVTRIPFGTGKGGGELFGLEGRPTPMLDVPIPTGMQEGGLNVTHRKEDGTFSLYQPGGDSAPEGSGTTITNADPSFLRALLGLGDARSRYSGYAEGPPPEIPGGDFGTLQVDADPVADLLASLFPRSAASMVPELEGLNITNEISGIFDIRKLMNDLLGIKPAASMTSFV